ncbi:MAG: isocitrate lyase/phosphoenolpyruvate mutase family protein [Candidatus Acidiferrales bacterium]
MGASPSRIMKTDQAEKARKFLALHKGPKTLLLPNAWDVASARIFEEAGFPAIATTSAGVANSLGYPDGQHIRPDEMLEVVRRIAEAVSVPVTADMEAGYGQTPEEVAATAGGVLEAGAVGMNLEDTIEERPDSLADLSLQKERIRAILEVTRSAGILLVLNARSDVILAGVGEPATRAQRTIERLEAYREAGAQSLFAPGVKDKETIAQLVRGVHGPLNILATAGTPPIAELEKIGVARVSLGSGPMRATMALVARIACQLREEGTYSLFTDGAITYTEANRLFEKR